jgi:cyclophilin family peptidyl-prolyl cis-trans isomerase
MAADRMRADDLPADDAPAASAADEVGDWDSLVARMREIEARVGQIREEFPDADAATQDELRSEFNRLVTELNNEIYVELAEQAGPRLEESPDDLVAAEIVMQQAFNANQFGRAAELADQILAETPDSSAALNFGGVAHYAIHEFERAHELLQTAEANGSLIDVLQRSDGSPFQVSAVLGSSEDYIEYWEEEQAIRAREAAAEGDEQLPRVKLVTSRGEIILELFENEAPNTVANFISLVEEGYYDELKFHRVIQWFMAQGGCPNTRPGSAGFPGGGDPGYSIACESHAENARRHFAGTLSMAHAGRDTGGSQFFITHLPTPHLDLPMNPNAHTVFGRVVEGMDVVAALQVGDVIESAEVLRKRDHAYEPVTIAPGRN